MATSSIKNHYNQSAYSLTIGGDAQTQYTIKSPLNAYAVILAVANQNNILDMWTPRNGNPIVQHYGANTITPVGVDANTFTVTIPVYTQIHLISNSPLVVS